MSSSTTSLPQQDHLGAPSPSGSGSDPRRVPSSSRRSHSHKKESMNGPLYMQSRNSTVLVRRIKRKGDSPSKQLARWFVENQIGFSFNLLALLFCAHYLLPRSQAYTSKFFTLQYYNEKSHQYGLGFDDSYYVFLVVVLCTGLRAAAMEYILAPLANYLGLRKKKEVTRFSEQAWLVIYCVVFWSLGFYLHYTSPAWLNLKNLWATWPNRELSGLFKFYVLTQLGFWFQQVFVINIEERRKDHWQMLSHHFITIVLIVASYRYHFNLIGNAVFILFDMGDILLSGSKCLKYAGYTTACDVGFGLFMFSWFINRHVLFNIICWSIYKHPSQILTRGCFRGTQDALEGPFEQPPGYGPYFEPFVKSEGLVCWQPVVTNTFLALLLALQVICVVWFTMIIKVAIRVISGAGADDVRSDEEGEEEEEEEDEFVYEEALPFEEEVGVEELDLKSWERRSGVKRSSSAATGVSLPGHSDRKELLGRIGCEKQVD